MINYQKYDKAVIITGDGDFHCLVKYLKNQGKLMRLLVPNRRKCSVASEMEGMHNATSRN
jgi:uncharacterized LabA/DUF88 family protein